MTHPAIPKIIELAGPVASSLGLELVGAVFQTNYKPPILRVDIRNPISDTSLDDCEKMSRAMESILEESDLLPDAYVLEISSPGISSVLSTDKEFASFKGFAVMVETSEPDEGHRQWHGKLLSRDETAVYLNQKGRRVVIPRSLVTKVQLDDRPAD